MQLKSEANTEPRKRFHLSARLRKAVGFAEEFAKLCESNKVDARTKLEAQVRRGVFGTDYLKSKIQMSWLPIYVFWSGGNLIFNRYLIQTNRKYH